MSIRSGASAGGPSGFLPDAGRDAVSGQPVWWNTRVKITKV